MSVKLVGLCGFAKTGKDTAAANMPGFTRLAFADALKRDLFSLLTVIGCDLDNPSHKFLARPLLVAWGEVARRFNPEFWIQRLALVYHKTEGNVVVTDVRYPNEVAWVQRNGGNVVRIFRDGYGPANEEEERSIAEIDMTFMLPKVRNDSTPEELGRKVLEVAGCA